MDLNTLILHLQHLKPVKPKQILLFKEIGEMLES